MIEITLSTFIIGLMASVLTEVFKIIPILRKNALSKSLTAIIVVILGTFYAVGFNVSAWDWNIFANVLVFSFLNYRIIVRPIAKNASLITQ